MGAIFDVPLARAASPAEMPGERIALLAREGEELSSLAEGREGPITLVIGAERDGLPADVIAACDRVGHIAIASESLNAAMAATVALYEMTRRPSRVRSS